MATLIKSIKRASFEKGKSTFKKVFQEFDYFGIKVRTVRKFKNDDKEGIFYTVELSKQELSDIAESLSELRDGAVATDFELKVTETESYFIDKSNTELEEAIKRLQNIIRSQRRAINRVRELTSDIQQVTNIKE